MKIHLPAVDPILRQVGSRREGLAVALTITLAGFWQGYRVTKRGVAPTAGEATPAWNQLLRIHYQGRFEIKRI